MNIGERLRAAAMAGLIASVACGGPEVPTRVPEVAAASAASRTPSAPKAPATPESPFSDPTKKLVADWLQAFLDGRIDDVVNLAPVAYRDAIRYSTPKYMGIYAPCRGRKIIDVSIIDFPQAQEGVGQLDQPCSIKPFDTPITITQLGVWLVKVDGKPQPIQFAFQVAGSY